ncbi:MAG TPA: Shedu immune nuclease family protein [Anaerolineales bacterium]|nr:Shedu immune nuclease family protein [Anaerolineales bacterium]
MAEDYEYFQNKRSDRVYLSRSLEKRVPYIDDEGQVRELVKPFRIISKVIDSSESHEFISDGKEVSLRITNGQRQEIVAKFYEDDRGIFTLQIQRYTIDSGMPHKTYFSFIGQEISTLYNFIRNVAVIPLNSASSAKLDDRFIEEIVLTREQLSQLISDHPELVDELIRHNTTSQEVALLGYRKQQLDHFRSLLENSDYFDVSLQSLGANKRPEDLWQQFFEQNTWIFGVGLSYQFNSPLSGKKLEQVVSGYDFQSPGKRVDGLLKTRGFLSSLAFAEIKTHKTPLLTEAKTPYRSGAWSVSREVAGGVAQIQRTVQESLRNIQTKTQLEDSDGAPTGEEVFLYTPRSFLVVGSLSAFEEEHGINEQKYSSFEMFRRNLTNPEIVTFDELYERAKHIVMVGTSK